MNNYVLDTIRENQRALYVFLLIFAICDVVYWLLPPGGIDSWLRLGEFVVLVAFGVYFGLHHVNNEELHGSLIFDAVRAGWTFALFLTLVRLIVFTVVDQQIILADRWQDRFVTWTVFHFLLFSPAFLTGSIIHKFRNLRIG